MRPNGSDGGGGATQAAVLKRAGVLMIGLAALFLAGCGPRGADCGTADSIAAVVPIVQQAITDRTQNRVRGFGGAAPAPLARVRAAVAQASVAIEDVRTTQSDPNSTRRFCAARLKITLPGPMLQDADQARQAQGQGDVSSLADAAGIERNADAFVADMEYSVQPTDDGSRIYAEVANSDGYVNFFSEVLAYHLLRPVIERQRREADQAAAEQQRAEQEQQRAQQAAVAEQQNAILEQARSEQRLAEQSINAVWRAVPPDTRQQLLEMQRAWIRRKNADCQIEAASASTVPQEREAVRLRCDARMNNDRARFLQQYVRY